MSFCVDTGTGRSWVVLAACMKWEGGGEELLGKLCPWTTRGSGPFANRLPPNDATAADRVVRRYHADYNTGTTRATANSI